MRQVQPTAKSIIKNSQESQPSIIEDTRLRERHFGIFEGKSRQEFHKAKSAGPNFKVSGGETAKQIIDRGMSFLDDICKDLNKDYGPGTGPQRDLGTELPSSEEDDEGSIDDGFEVVFARDEDDNSQGASKITHAAEDHPSSTTTQDASSGTTAMAAKPSRSSTHTSHSCTALKSSHGASGGSKKAMKRGSRTQSKKIFVSEITGVCSLPGGYPHILISIHGSISRNLFQKLQEQYKIDIPGGVKVLRRGCPNTGLSTFVVELDSEGQIWDIECYFVYRTDHLTSEKS